MKVMISVEQPTLDMANEIADSLGKVEGKKPSRSHVVRLAIATMRKRMSDEGLLKESTP
jgi:hypothetical protein